MFLDGLEKIRKMPENKRRRVSRKGRLRFAGRKKVKERNKSTQKEDHSQGKRISGGGGNRGSSKAVLVRLLYKLCSPDPRKGDSSVEEDFIEVKKWGRGRGPL